MVDYGLPVLFALFVWWFSTGVVLYLGRRPRGTYRWSMLGMTVVLGLSTVALVLTSSLTTPLGAYLAFTAGLLIWGWHEMAFLMGFLVGARTEPCPEDATGYDRFVAAFAAINHHELAILGTGIIVIALAWDAPNPVGAWTFAVLWGMRISAKLNVYLGVPNLAEEFLPDHLAYLKTYFRNRRINLLFPVSVTVGALFTAALVHLAVGAPAGSFEAAAYTLVAALSGLAVIEHWLLVLPLPDAALWHWALPTEPGDPGVRKDLGQPDAGAPGGVASVKVALEADHKAATIAAFAGPGRFRNPPRRRAQEPAAAMRTHRAGPVKTGR
ncbi:MAG: putative photosynthetic complex assembly protein PuhE [Pseudomonadota bacterium]